MNGNSKLGLRRQGGKPIVAINVGCMFPYMDYEPRTLGELLEARKGEPDYFSDKPKTKE